METNLGADETEGGRTLGRRGMSVFALVLGGAFFLAGLGALIAGFRQSTDWIGWLVGGIFTATGATIVAVVVGVNRRRRAALARRAEHPQAPWRWRQDWARGEIPARTGAGAVAAWGFALFWNAVSAPLCWFLPREWAKGNHLAAIGLIFPLVGLGLLTLAIRETLRWFHCGRCVFRLENEFGALGGSLLGRVVLARPLHPAEDPLLRLRCTRRPRGDGNSGDDVCLWEHEVRIDRTLFSPTGATELPVVFVLPDYLPTSSLDSDFGSISWQLSVRAKQAGPNLRLNFEVPVFAAPSPSATSPFRQFSGYSPSVDPSLYRKADAAAAIAQAGLIWLEHSLGESELRFPAGRTRGTGVVAALFAIGAVAGSIAVILSAGSWIAAIGLGVFALTLGWVASFTLFDGSRVRLVGDHVIVVRDQLFGRKTIELRRMDVARCEIRQTMTSGDKVWYSLTLIGRPLGDGALSPAGAEPFAVRKLRYQSTKAAAHAPARAAEMLRQVAALPAFTILAGTGVQGHAIATTIAGFLEEKIRGDNANAG